jgi:acyl-CoA synthetase (AMP-forming)/AMP-acid ligase II
VILEAGNASEPPAPRDGASTLDDLLRRAAAARPDGPALIDPPDRASFTDGAPRRLTWAEADRVVSSIANLLRSLGLPPGAIVALQLPNVVESVLALMGVLRAGLIAAPLPLLWRQAETCAALGRVSARALISCRRVGEVDHAELAMHVAAETFAIRFVGAFGAPVPDGIIPLDEVFDAALPAPPPPLDPLDDAAGRPAVVTFDVAADGFVPVARSHRELIAAGEIVAGAVGLTSDATLLGAFMTASFAGLGATVVPWLISGATLLLHQPFNPAALAAQRADVAVLPGPLLARFAEAGLIGAAAPSVILAVWRAPERMRAGAAWASRDTRVVDVPAFGEIGLLALPRDAEGAAQLPDMGTAAAAGLELKRGAAGTLCLRGAMVPAHPCPPGSPRGPQFNLAVATDGFVDTLFPCHVDRATGRLVIDGPPAGLVSVGGYRFAVRDLQDLVAPIDPDGSIAPLPDALAGHRLAGVGTDRAAIGDKLAEQGSNPLVVGAFHDQGPGRASAA